MSPIWKPVRISRKWLQLDFEQLQDLLLLLGRLVDLLELDASDADLLLANAAQMLEHISHRPFPVLALAILFKERLQPLLHVPVDVIGQPSADELKRLFAFFAR